MLEALASCLKRYHDACSGSMMLVAEAVISYLQSITASF